MPQDSVTVEQGDGVALLTLNRPRHRNLLDAGMVDALSDALDRLEEADEVRAVVVTGAGTAFCAGADLATLLRAADGGFDDVKHVYEGFLRVMHSPLPTIAAVNGPAVGAGLNLALACDVRLASTDAMFESRFLKLRLHPGGGHSWLLTRAVGRQLATAMTLFGRALSAEEARAAGLVLSVHRPEELVAAAVDLASGVRGMEAMLVRRTAATLRAAEAEPDHAAILALETGRQQWSTTRPEFVEHTRMLAARISSRRSQAPESRPTS